jgi:hypothetical protein
MKQPTLKTWEVVAWKLTEPNTKYWSDDNQAWLQKLERKPIGRPMKIVAPDGMAAAKTYARCNQIAESDWNDLKNKNPLYVIRCTLQGKIKEANVTAKAQHWGNGREARK